MKMLFSRSEVLIFIVHLDIDECLSPILNMCDQTCQNTLGSYTCGCESGYTKWNITHCEGKCEIVFEFLANKHYLKISHFCLLFIFSIDLDTYKIIKT